MKLRSSIIGLVLLPFIPLLLVSQNNSLSVGDPRVSSYTQKGTIEEALLSVRNKGLFLEYGLYLTFSARGSAYKASDSLEVVLNFTLPQKSIVTDSWLWINQDICKAKILDIWSASNYYENIVKRRRDPSILTKISDTQYNLRIFPMIGSGQRKVKITYLVPLNWSTENVTASLPMNIINTSRFTPAEFPLLIWSDKDWKNVSLDGKNQFGFMDQRDSVWGDYKTTAILSSGLYPDANISFANPMKNGFYMTYFPGNPESVYQIAIQPPSFTEKIKNQKIAFLIDFQQQSSSYSKQEVLDLLKSEIKKSLTDVDSFNLFFSNINIIQTAKQWLPASDVLVDLAFAKAADKLVSFSNLPSLINAGLQFINQQDGAGKIVLLNNSYQFASSQAANDLIQIIKLQNIHSTQINVLDYCNNFYSYLINGRYYYNNEYLFLNLSYPTGGFYINIRNGKLFDSALAEGMTQTLPRINGIDLHLKLQQGITYGKYPMGSNPDNPPANAIYTQTGLFRGDFPFVLELSGEIDKDIFYITFDINESDVTKIDSSAKAGWSAQGIQKLEAQTSSNSIIQDIISKSIESRVLSRYTAFLCIEDTSLFCKTCFDESGLPTANNDEDKDSLNQLTVFPNPFKDHLNIELHYTNAIYPKKVIAEISDLSGKIIHHFTIEKEFKEGILQYIWNGKSDIGEDVPSGAYILVVHTKGKPNYSKILKF